MEAAKCQHVCVCVVAQRRNCIEPEAPVAKWPSSLARPSHTFGCIRDYDRLRQAGARVFSSWQCGLSLSLAAFRRSSSFNMALRKVSTTTEMGGARTAKLKSDAMKGGGLRKQSVAKQVGAAESKVERSPGGTERRRVVQNKKQWCICQICTCGLVSARGGRGVVNVHLL